MEYQVIVIGAGPAGLMAAIRAAEKGKKVLVLEKMNQPCRKLAITGKGRCNITNTLELQEFIKRVHPDGRFLRNCFSRYFSADILKMLNENGVPTVEERGGRVFPASSQAKDVVQALLKVAARNKVTIQTGAIVNRLVADNNKITHIEVSRNGGKQNIPVESCILTTGGMSYPATGSTGDGYRLAEGVGHTISEPRPALVPLETEENFASKCSGLNLRNINATLWIDGKKAGAEFGELLFTDTGLSGPVILTLSRNVFQLLSEMKKVEISIDLKPALDDQKLDKRLLRDFAEFGKSNLTELCRKWLPGQIIEPFIDELSISRDKTGSTITAAERKKIRLLLKDLRFRITKCRPFSEAIVTAGGISTKEIDAVTMRSKRIDNLYFAGEVIDLDGDTGGYNLQIAFSTGWVAGDSCL